MSASALAIPKLTPTTVNLLDKPTRGMLEEHPAHAEGGETAVAFATGMAAMSASLPELI